MRIFFLTIYGLIDNLWEMKKNILSKLKKNVKFDFFTHLIDHQSDRIDIKMSHPIKLRLFTDFHM